MRGDTFTCLFTTTATACNGHVTSTTTCIHIVITILTVRRRGCICSHNVLAIRKQSTTAADSTYQAILMLCRLSPHFTPNIMPTFRLVCTTYESSLRFLHTIAHIAHKSNAACTVGLSFRCVPLDTPPHQTPTNFIAGVVSYDIQTRQHNRRSHLPMRSIFTLRKSQPPS